MHLRWFALTMLLVGCADVADRPATWSYVYPAVVAPSCATATCHSQLAARAGVVLDEPEQAYALLVVGPSADAGPYVFPGDPASSPLMLILDGDERVQMPPNAPLPRAERALVEAWILDGARP